MKYRFAYLACLAPLLACGASPDEQGSDPAVTSSSAALAAFPTATVLATGMNPDDLTAFGREVYWADFGDPFTGKGAGIFAVPKEGGNTRAIVRRPGTQHLALTPFRIVFADQESVLTVPWGTDADSANPEKIASTNGASGPLATDGFNVYFGDEDGVKSVSVFGGPVRTLLEAPHHVYFTLTVSGLDLIAADYTAGTVSRIPIFGGAPEVMASGQDGPLYPVGRGLDVYWLIPGNYSNPRAASLVKQSFFGGAPSPVVEGVALFHPHGLTFDGLDFYTVTEGGGLVRIPGAGGAPVQLHPREGHDGGHAVTTDATHVYWTQVNRVLALPK